MRSHRVAVVGSGYFGALHAEKYAEIPNCELVAVCDIDEKKSRSVAARCNTEALVDQRDLFGRIDAVSIAVPTRHHFAAASEFLARGVHVLLEKPISETLEQADMLDELARKNGVVLQVGHLERFNPAILGSAPHLTKPRFIECRRMSPFQKRVAETNVVLDMMIHDLDLVFSMVDSPFEQIDAFGVSVLSDVEDFVNARIRFANGCVATLTASRTSSVAERTFNVSQNHNFITIDLVANKFSVTSRVNGGGNGTLPQVKTEERMFAAGGVLKRQIESFLNAVETGGKPCVTATDGRKALEAALIISSTLEPHVRMAVA